MQEVLGLPSDVLFHIGPVEITNSVLAASAVSLLMIGGGIALGRYKSLVPNRAQAAFELVLEFLLETVEKAYGSNERARKFIPLYMTIFMFIAITNQFTVIPIINSFFMHLGEHEAHLFRMSTTDWSMTIAFAFIVFFASQIIAFLNSPLGHIGQYLRIGNLLKARSFGEIGMGLLDVFIGIIEFVGDLAKPLSLSARLFGNIYAGELMVIVISGIAFPITQYFVPMPFLALGIFVGVIQAFVFTLLSTLFSALTLEHATGHH